MHLNYDASIGSAKPEILPTNMSINILPNGSPLQRKVPHIGWEIISNQNNLNLSPYLSNLVVNIDKNLPRDENLPTGQMKVSFKILKNGTLSDIKIVESSYLSLNFPSLFPSMDICTLLILLNSTSELTME